MSVAIVLKAANSTTSEFAWGKLQWFAGRGLANSEDMTVGECTIYPGQQNPLHSHPNCEEVLHLLTGTIEHTANEERYVLTAGDTITVPRHVRHNARNIGETTALMSIAFSSADRQMQPE